ncbi:MAG TPA: rRNA maturation RNase YbeY [Acidimicrobiales bacterium]|nr:rRNA maturation RNase YbeY [Acidimicrobiales bacterium]
MSAQVFAADEQSDRPVDLARWVALAERVLGDRGIGDGTELSLMFVDERAIAELNERFLGRRGPTDVLSFPIEDELIGPGHIPDQDASGPGRGPTEHEDMPLLIGDVVICPEAAWQQAPQHAGTYEDELALLLVHGILHLLGMDHGEEGEAAAMEALEQQLLAAYHREPAT